MQFWRDLWETKIAIRLPLIVKTMLSTEKCVKTKRLPYPNFQKNSSRQWCIGKNFANWSYAST